MTDIVEETNRYAEQVMGQDCYREWRKITKEELKAFFGFSILMGIDHLPMTIGVETHSSTTLLLPTGSLGGVFREISRYLHFVNNDEFATLYEPSKDVAVDEAMIKFQGRSSLKQYMPAKPIKRGIKVWVLGDSSNGYFSRFDVYTGRKEDHQVGLGAHVVQTLTEDLKDKHHHVYFDNFFTSYQLLEDLEEDGIYGCGTARKDRKEFPTALKNPGLKER